MDFDLLYISVSPLSQEVLPEDGSQDAGAGAVILGLLESQFRGSPLIKETLTAMASALYYHVTTMLEHRAPAKMLVGYDVDGVQRIHLSLYTTHDGGAVLRGMGFRNVFTMNEWLQYGVLKQITNTDTHGLVNG